jgi:hypothetical protein
VSDTYQRNTPGRDDRGGEHVDPQRADRDPLGNAENGPEHVGEHVDEARVVDDDGRVEERRPDDDRYVDDRPRDVDDDHVDRTAQTDAYAAPVAARPVTEDVTGRREVVAEDAPVTRDAVVGRERAEFGGIKWGSAFFGWLAAMGMAVLLVAILSAIGAGVGLGSTGGDASDAAQEANDNATTVGLVGAIALAVILFVSYYCGGYVAGRMARFAGAKQGVAVWLWAVVFAVIGAIIAAIAGSQYDVLGKLNSFPRIPIDEGTLTAGSIVTVIVVALLSLGGAVLGGLAGMRYHRAVDRVGFAEG